jgi:hypothetical protein
LNVHAIEWKSPTDGPPWLSGSYPPGEFSAAGYARASALACAAGAAGFAGVWTTTVPARADDGAAVPAFDLRGSRFDQETYCSGPPGPVTRL